MAIASFAVYDVLSELYDPYQGVFWVAADQIRVTDRTVVVSLPYPAERYHSVVQKQIEDILMAHWPDDAFDVFVQSGFDGHENARGMMPVPGVRNILVVASGKGGVGKSTVALQLAKAYRDDGARVGFLDADVYGPSFPQMLGGGDLIPEANEKKMMKPLFLDGLQVMSIGYLIRDDAAVAWRGPMATQALIQLLMNTSWDDVDLLIVDMPPGTGDIYLTLSQKVPVTGAVVVVTPHPLAFQDARRSLTLFERVGIPVFGIVENMSFWDCSSCAMRHFPFGSGSGERLASELELPLLGHIPILPSLSDGSGESTELFFDLSRRVGALLSRLKKKSSPGVRIEIKPVS